MKSPLPDPTELFQAIKADALPGIWSQGVKLARTGTVELAPRQASEIVFRVPTPGRAVAPTVVLYADELEWTCDCGGRNDPCEHAIAAAIAWQQGGLKEPSTGEAAPKLLYRLSVERGQLRVRRFLQNGGEQRELAEALSSLVAQGRCPFTPTQDDIQIDRLLAAVPRGDFNLGQVQRLLAALESREVELDGSPVKVRKEPLKPSARVFDSGDSIVLEIVQSPEFRRVLAPGVVYTGEIRPAGAVELCGLRMERLPLTRRMSVRETSELVERVLPEVEKSVEVVIESKRLPRRTREKPRIEFDLSHEGHTLSVLATLVYGRPPSARVDGDRLELLGTTAPRRDRASEHALLAQLRDRLNLVPGRRVHFDGAEAARFAERLRAFATEPAGEARALPDVPALVPQLDFDAAHFEVGFRVAGGDEQQTASPEAVFRAWRDGVQLVPLAGGGFGTLPSAWLERYGEQVASLLAARAEHGALPMFAVPTLAKLCDALGQPPPLELERLAPLFRGFHGLPAADLPPDLRATLRPYQLDAVRWLSFLRQHELGAVLADDMGLGKTLQTLCAVSGRTLVVCPKSVLFNWEREIRRFRPGLSISLYHGPNRRLDPHADVVLTTYAVLRLDIDALAELPWDQCVLDEAQAIKNPGSQAAQAAFRLSGRFKLALSGTPIENRLDELWSIFRFTHPGLLGSHQSFDERFTRPIASGDDAAAARLKELTRPFLLRRLKKDVARDLPPRTDAILPIELDPAERDAYDAILAATKGEVVRALKEGGSVLGALEALLRLRQAACHRGLLPGQNAEGSTKTEALMDALGDLTADGHKALVFSQWTSFLDRIEPHLKHAEIGYLRLDGSTRDRGAVVESFQSEHGPPVLLASLKAGGTGLNLTAADHVFIMDPWYNPATEEQAADRAHRIGQDRPVNVYRLVAKNTVEEGILELQEKKRAIAENALAGTAGATAITRDDLLALLE
ncbi:MAG TPA: DEAD/DEAH box helicase [Polyangiaceae bacterium]